MSNRDREPTWRDLEVGSIFVEPGSTAAYKTGDWRSEAPSFDLSKCIKCALCQVYCPEGCVEEDEEGYFHANLYWCKGCGICAEECPTDVITMVEESE